jgi:hypothetical protein
MHKKYDNLFKNLRPSEPSADLLDKILFRINREQVMEHSLRMKVRLIVSSAVSLIMLIFLLPVWNLFQTEITQTGFSQFMSLIFSDLNSILIYWQDFGMSLLESIPFFSLAGLLTVILILLFSGKYMVHDIKTFFMSRHLPLLKI